MPIIEIQSWDHPGAEIFSSLTEAQLRNRLDPERGIFIAESPKVILVALNDGYEPKAILCEAKHITDDAADIIHRYSDKPVIDRCLWGTEQIKILPKAHFLNLKRVKF